MVSLGVSDGFRWFQGKAFVPRDDLVSLVANEFRLQLSRALVMTARALPHLEEDERLLPKLANLSQQYVGQDYSLKKTAGKVTLDQIDGGIGLSLEEALIFWRAEFTKLMDVDKFDKQYAYNIRHNYGKEGKRADYTPYSCMKIIMSNPPGPGDHHGCPFGHSDADLLRQRLSAFRVPKKGVDEIMAFVKDSHYQLACTRYYELTHGVMANSAINHPNQYFDESRQVTQKEQGGASKMGSATPSGIQHGRVAIKREINSGNKVNIPSNGLSDIYMNDDDEDDLLGEIERMDTIA